MKRKNPTKDKEFKEEDISEDLDLTQGMGIIPDDIPFTQNIGCVGGKTKSAKTSSKTKDEKS
ncbi:hypothetical protein [Algoriphagus pacificus]|uniref:Uncharacterized protein n=1 Tax=Algoriphagus pacificus TaxID=2811234 RepID=A0ABS3CC98_9BACT|nr:hypothetical protein [Algoriphagus pacificus]MBN7814154.1 hypothetical protein [Algoriphagus pacificus]